MDQCSEKQAWRIYYEIYGETINKETLNYESTEQQEWLRDQLMEKNGWDKDLSRFHLVDKIHQKLTPQTANYVLTFLLNNDYEKAEEILTTKI